MEDLERKEIEEKPVELSFLEREASELASDPNMWHAKQTLKIIDLLNSIATSLNMIVKYNEERKLKEAEMMSKMGGFMGGIVPGAGMDWNRALGATMKQMLFGHKKDKEVEGQDCCKDGF